MRQSANHPRPANCLARRRSVPLGRRNRPLLIHWSLVRSQQVFQALGEATQANLTVLRDGAPQALVVDTTQLQSLKVNRQ